ncbi:MAG: hypothetical protein P4M12_11220 [Gammaproteobacteria bacterium]|nr:hypothetical protein [Gammaproteobacteria bacterium]
MTNLQEEILKLETQINTDKALLDIHTSLLKQHMHQRNFIIPAMLGGFVGGLTLGYFRPSSFHATQKFREKSASLIKQLYKNIRIVLPLIL